MPPKNLQGIHEAQKEQMDDKLQSFFNIAMHSELDDYEIKAKAVNRIPSMVYSR